MRLQNLWVGERDNSWRWDAASFSIFITIVDFTVLMTRDKVLMVLWTQRNFSFTERVQFILNPSAQIILSLSPHYLMWLDGFHIKVSISFNNGRGRDPSSIIVPLHLASRLSPCKDHINWACCLWILVLLTIVLIFLLLFVDV